MSDAHRLAYDVVNATLAHLGCDDVIDTIARANAVSSVRSLPDFEAVSSAFKRMNNILKQAWKENKRVADSLNPSALSQPEEKTLAEAVPGVAKDVDALRRSGQYEKAL